MDAVSSQELFFQYFFLLLKLTRFISAVYPQRLLSDTPAKEAATRWERRLSLIEKPCQMQGWVSPTGLCRCAVWVHSWKGTLVIVKGVLK